MENFTMVEQPHMFQKMKPYKTKRKGPIDWFIQNTCFYVLGKNCYSGCGMQIVDVQILSYISGNVHVCSNIHVGFFCTHIFKNAKMCKIEMENPFLLAQKEGMKNQRLELKNNYCC